MQLTIMLRDNGAPDVMAPGNIGRADISRYDWMVRTQPQTFLDNKDRSYPQGKVVGGGTLLNGMVWTRASASDYDSWVDLGNDGWGWEDLYPYFVKV
jgi:choline dehydrogenase